MKLLIFASFAVIALTPMAKAWDYHKFVDPVEGTTKWSCVYDADHSAIPKKLCIMVHVDTTTASLSLSNGTTHICDEVVVSYKINGSQTYLWGGELDDETVSFNLNIDDREIAMLSYGSRLVIHTLDSCGNSSLMDLDISGGLPVELFDDSL